MLYVPGNHFISTKRNKGGKPDGYIHDINNSTWSIVESELLKHGVWEHIAEQIMRFIVAAQNDVTKRKIRDIFFDEIESQGLIPRVSQSLGIPPHRSVQRIENVIEGQTPDIVIFIDDVNEDLEDMIEALNTTVKVFKIQKYDVNGVIEYLAPEGSQTLIETTIEDISTARVSTAETLELLGVGRLVNNVVNIRFYKLESGDKVSLKYSKYYPSDRYYWYGITPSTLEKYEDHALSHLVLILGTEGVIKLPFRILKEYLDIANKTLDTDQQIRHYHVTIKSDPQHMLWINQDKPSWEIEECFYLFES